MEKQIKTIGVLTSGGDAPGMNAAVRAVVRTGLHKGYRMIGIQRGYNGLLNGECFEMNLRSVSNIISAGGTILYTARCLEFKTKEGQDKGAEKCRELGIDALVVIGGDGSYRGARELAHRGIPMIGLPGGRADPALCGEPAEGLSYYAGGAGLCGSCGPAHRWPRESAGVQRGRAGRGAERDPADAVWRH